MLIFTLFVLYAATYEVRGKMNCPNVAEAKTNVEEALAILHKTQTMLTQDCEKKPYAVGFQALLAPDVTLGFSQTVVFDTVITNLGDAYDLRTGHFTAPYDGTYFFTSSFLKTPGTSDLHLFLVNQGNRIAQGYAASGSGYEAGSMSAVVSLKKGDIVKVIHPPGVGSQAIRGDGWSAFTGYLII